MKRVFGELFVQHLRHTFKLLLDISIVEHDTSCISVTNLLHIVIEATTPTSKELIVITMSLISCHKYLLPSALLLSLLFWDSVVYKVAILLLRMSQVNVDLMSLQYQSIGRMLLREEILILLLVVA